MKTEYLFRLDSGACLIIRLQVNDNKCNRIIVSATDHVPLDDHAPPGELFGLEEFQAKFNDIHVNLERCNRFSSGLTSDGLLCMMVVDLFILSGDLFEVRLIGALLKSFPFPTMARNHVREKAALIWPQYWSRCYGYYRLYLATVPLE